jgi:hypothetical protein
VCDTPEATSSGLNYTAAIAYGIIKPPELEGRVGVIPGTNTLATEAVRAELHRYNMSIHFEPDQEYWRLYWTVKKCNDAKFTEHFFGTFVECCRRAVEIIHHA